MANTIKVHPHKYMDRAKNDIFLADHIAYIVLKRIMNFLDDKLGSISYEDISTNESYELTLLHVDDDTLQEIKWMFPNVHCYMNYFTSNSYSYEG
jgi:hypothetical protein